MAKKTEHILIIDDDESCRLFTRKILEASGYSVSETIDGKTGIQEARSKTPHLIILDLMLGEESGFDFLKEVRDDPKLGNIPILVASGLNDKDSVYKAISLGTTDYLTKPFDAPILLKKVLKHLRDRDFHTVVFPIDARPQIKMEMQGTILPHKESRFLLELPCKLAPHTRIQLTSPYFQEIGISQAVFTTSRAVGVEGQFGRFTSDIVAAGLDSETIIKLKQRS